MVLLLETQTHVPVSVTNHLSACHNTRVQVHLCRWKPVDCWSLVNDLQSIKYLDVRGRQTRKSGFARVKGSCACIWTNVLLGL